MGKTWFTADTHFGHDRIMEMTGRPYKHIDEHDREVIYTINKYVAEEDRLFILGDFAWRAAQSYVDRIRCPNLHLIWGNHDRANFGKAFKTTEDVTEIKLGEIKVFLSHYPHCYWPSSHYGSLHLYGHLHSERERTLDEIWPTRRSMDVGLDNIRRLFGELRPIQDVEIINRLMARPGHDPVTFYREQEQKRLAEHLNVPPAWTVPEFFGEELKPPTAIPVERQWKRALDRVRQFLGADLRKYSYVEFHALACTPGRRRFTDSSRAERFKDLLKAERNHRCEASVIGYRSDELLPELGLITNERYRSSETWYSSVLQVTTNEPGAT